MASLMTENILSTYKYLIAIHFERHHVVGGIAMQRWILSSMTAPNTAPPALEWSADPLAVPVSKVSVQNSRCGEEADVTWMS